MTNYIDFADVRSYALSHAEYLVKRWLPSGKRVGNEWVARNPRRNDANLGSFKINLKTGKWCDFAGEDRGGDLISLRAFLLDWNYRAAAFEIAETLDHAFSRERF